MDKRLLLAGIALIIIGLVAGSSQMPALQNVGRYSSTVVVAGNSFAEGSLNMNTNSVLWFYYAAAAPVDFYMLNQSGHSAFASATASNSVVAAFNSIAHGVGVVYSAENGTFMNLTVLAYSSANITYPAGNYFFIFRNRNAAISNVTYAYVTVPSSELEGSGSAYGSAFTAGSIVSAALFLAGVVLAFLSLFRGRDKKQQGAVDEEASKIYKDIEHGTGTRGRRRAKGRKTRRKKGRK